MIKEKYLSSTPLTLELPTCVFCAARVPKMNSFTFSADTTKQSSIPKLKSLVADLDIS